MRRRAVLVMMTTMLCVSVCGGVTRAQDDAAKPELVRALVITGEDVSSHPWREITLGTLKALYAAERFDVTVEEGIATFGDKERLESFDVVVFLLCNMGRFPEITDGQMANLDAFVKGGGGFYIQHIASASFQKSCPAFSKLCGRWWKWGEAGHGPRSVFKSEIRNPDHPVTKGLNDFDTDDELYAKLTVDVEDINVLVDAYSDWSGKQEPLIFWFPYGEGRVFYNTYGHDGKALATPEVQTLIARGVEFAATGDVK